MSQAWYVAQLKPGAARIAEQNLRRQGFAIFSPKIRHTFRRSGRFHDELRPLFPGYLLVGSAPQPARWRAIGGTHGVRCLVSFGANGPAALPAGVVDALKEHYREAAAPKAGDLVRVISGPFADLVAKIERLAAQDRIFVLLDVMGQPCRVSMPVRDVLPHPAAESVGG